MANMFLKIVNLYQKNYKHVNRVGMVLASTLLYTSAANAGLVDALCTIVGYYKQIMGAAALVAGLMLALNSFFSKNALIADLLQTVIITCVIVGVLPALIGVTGLTVGCA